MPGTKLTFATVRKIAHVLPDVAEGTMYGSPALKVHGRLLTCLAIHKSAEPESLVVRTDFDERAALLAEQPDTYYVTDHYVNHPAVLVRLSKIRIDQLRDLLALAWRFVIAHESRVASRHRVKGNKRFLRERRYR
ncbi:MAG: hypothetical protein DMG57_05560 [Acidobacteria bacterium]|nr:MAG: hypothetical protein DMG57_05560 [Acidobacteriota bacterium]